jgi:hypothetical protein
MIQLCSDRDLEEEPLGAKRRCQLGLEDLDGDIAMMFGVPGEIHGRHPTSAEFALECVAVGESGFQALKLVW